MNILYTGKTDDLLPEQRDQLQGRYAKLAKLLDGKGEKEAHMILTTERHLHNAEITVNYRDHGFVSTASDGDLFTAMCVAVDKLEKQVRRIKDKRRDSFREGRDKFRESETAPAAVAPPVLNGAAHKTAKRVFRPELHAEQKPMTVDEALLHMEEDRDYFVFEDVELKSKSVLIRRRDGHFDLVNC